MKKIEILLVSAAALIFGTAVQAGDSRVWTSRQGTTLEGELYSADTTAVTIVDKAGKSTKVKIEDLSIGDREYVVQYGKVDPKIIGVGEAGVPEKQFRLDEKTFEKLKDKLSLGTAAYEVMTTEHFVVVCPPEVRPNIFGETAERLWHGMAFEHMDFRSDWADKRMMIIVSSNEKMHTAAGQAFFKYLKDQGQADEAGNQAVNWAQPGAKYYEISKEDAAKYNARQEALYYYLPDMGGFKKPMSPLLVHSLAQDLMVHVAATNPRDDGSFAFTAGHAYYKEYQLAGEIQTVLGGVGGGKDERKGFSKEGWKEKWPVELRKRVKKGEVRPNLRQLMLYRLEKLDQSEVPLALCFSWAYYMESSNQRLAYFDEFVRRVAASHRVPEPQEVAAIFGFKSVDEFEADWTEFIKEGNFR